ncbi:hypothetical protein [Cyanobium gracile]|uniref:Uncharacterized protein n=1 Tax=Cyanobium gracile (strain ATCC 27147 / PCC 6307) TaxID=292564 RepID=K9P579_CYAGP|nr:hypothetical protein [Cyanobium gracile]AFY28557.1 hypothetical protein Cyagr_1386 [Cyanobium gracile PCC 6307]
MILASAHDGDARRLQAAWAHQAVLLTPRDLSLPGWRLVVEETGEGRWACQGVDRPDEAISAVLTRLVQVDPLELTWIQPPRRHFVAAEMTAFLLAWLEGLGCPVIDRPSPGCLCGRNWGWSHWAAHASGCGIPVRDQGPDPDGTRLVTMVGDTVIGAGADEEAAWTRRLGAGAAQEMASFRFQGEGAERALVQARVGLERVGAAELDALDRLLEERVEAG